MIKDLAIKNVPVNDLVIDNKNPNRMKAKQIDALKKSIERWGFIVPVITNKKYLIADGHQRLTAAKELGFKEVPCVVLDVQEVDRLLLQQVMNKLKGEHVDTLDVEAYKVLSETNDLSTLALLTGQREKDFLLAISRQEYIDLNEPKTVFNEEIYVSYGDMFKLGDNYLLCGDALNLQDYNKLLFGSKADMMFTDPPYNVDYVPEERPIGGRARSVNQLGGIINDKDFDINVFIELLPKIINGAFYICQGTKDAPKMELLLRALTGRESTVIVWAKNNHSIGRRDYHRKHEFIFYNWFDFKYWDGDRTDTDLWEVSRDPSNEYVHPTQKPIELALRAIKHSCPPGGTVIDPFGGSGSTLIACEKLGVKCYVMEKDPKYVQTIISRWESLTGKKAEKMCGTDGS